MNQEVLFAEPGVPVRVIDGISKGAVGVTTGEVREAILTTLVGVRLPHRVRFVRVDFLEVREP